MKALLERIRGCGTCAAHLPHGPRPIIQADPAARVLIVGQAPGSRVHKSGVPWADASGKQLRTWLGVEEAAFYDACRFALLPMGFCYPGKGKSGDLPPRPECAPLWHARVLHRLPQIQLTLLMGHYAQRYYLGAASGATLTDTVRSFRAHLPRVLPLPHPSPRNRFWTAKNPWFETDLIPVLRKRVRESLAG